MTLEGFKDGVVIVNSQWVSVLQNEGAERLAQEGEMPKPMTWHRQPDTRTKRIGWFIERSADRAGKGDGGVSDGYRIVIRIARTAAFQP